MQSASTSSPVRQVVIGIFSPSKDDFAFSIRSRHISVLLFTSVKLRAVRRGRDLRDVNFVSKEYDCRFSGFEGIIGGAGEYDRVSV